MASDQQLLQNNSRTDTPGSARAYPNYQSQEPLPEQKSCTGYCVYKALSIAYAVFYVIIGVLLLALGIWVLISKRQFDYINDIVSSPAILCIVVGLIVILTALIGCVGAAIDRLWPLRVFLGIIVLVFIIQVVIGILAYVYREKTISSLEGHVTLAVQNYRTDDGMKYAVDQVQRSWKCCGFKNATDWNKNSYYSCDSESKYSCGAPDSCCLEEIADCGLGTRSSKLMSRRLNQNGCQFSFLAWIEKNLDILGATALGLAIMHILGMFVVYMLITKIEDRIRLFKYRERYYKS
jgi:hypothetical protein